MSDCRARALRLKGRRVPLPQATHARHTMEVSVAQGNQFGLLVRQKAGKSGGFGGFAASPLGLVRLTLRLSTEPTTACLRARRGVRAAGFRCAAERERDLLF